MRHLGVVVAVRSGKPGITFHKPETQGEVSDDSDDEVHAATAWKLGPARKCRSTLERFIRGWDALADTFRDAPASCSEWADKVQWISLLTISAKVVNARATCYLSLKIEGRI